MAIPYVGHGACLGFGRESTWGTEVARAAWMRVQSTAINREIEKVGRPHLGTHGSAYFTRRDHFVARDDIGGSFEVPMAYDDFTVGLLVYAFGGVSDAGSGPSSYTHTITCADPGQTGLTIEQINGTGSGEQFEGIKIDSAEISIEAEGTMMLRCDVIGQTNSGLESAGTPSFPSSVQYINHSHAGQFTFDSVAKDLVSMTIRRARGMGRRRLLGSALTAEPVSTESPAVMGTLVVEYDSTSHNGRYISDTQGDATITFTGSGGASFAITLHNIYLKRVSRTVAQVGVIREEYEYECEATSSESGVSMVMTNDNQNWYDNG